MDDYRSAGSGLGDRFSDCLELRASVTGVGLGFAMYLGPLAGTLGLLLFGLIGELPLLEAPVSQTPVFGPPLPEREP